MTYVYTNWNKLKTISCLVASYALRRMMGLENPQRICVQYVLKLSILQAQRPRKVLLDSMSWAFFPATRKPSSLSMYWGAATHDCHQRSHFPGLILLPPPSPSPPPSTPHPKIFFVFPVHIAPLGGGGGLHDDPLPSPKDWRNWVLFGGL